MASLGRISTHHVRVSAFYYSLLNTLFACGSSFLGAREKNRFILASWYVVLRTGNKTADDFFFAKVGHLLQQPNLQSSRWRVMCLQRYESCLESLAYFGGTDDRTMAWFTEFLKSTADIVLKFMEPKWIRKKSYTGNKYQFIQYKTKWKLAFIKMFSIRYSLF